ncbi:MAG: hypothetical protein AB7E47_14625 [Desulfovibrionaceae bacterium]
MEQLILLSCVVCAVCIVIKMYYNKSVAFRREMSFLGEELERLEEKRKELEEEERHYQKLIVQYKVDMEDAYGAMEEERIQHKEATIKKAKAPKTPVEVLLQKRYVKPEDVQKAEEYRRNTKSPLPVEQILIMFERITPQQLKLAQDQIKPK